jgi:aspartyl-tRNA(Asn)/glutamyl-tRNA(Gln) amidotransferase subunit A
VPVGLTNLDEFAMGSSGENSGARPTRNPWDLARAPGGSSSGSAAAVAAVSRYGLVAFASSLDQVGWLATSVADLELVGALVSGEDERDSTSLRAGPIDPRPRRGDLRGLRIGVAREHFPDDLAPSVRGPVEAALRDLERLGAELVEVELPHTGAAIATYYVVATAEASSNLARYDGVRYGARARGDGSLQGMIAATRAASFGPEVDRRVLLGTFVLSSGYHEAWYVRALRVRRLIRREFDAAFERVDLIAGPTAPTPAFRLGEKRADPVAMYRCDALTVPSSLAGLPAVSVPCGLAREDGAELPVGLQLCGPPLGDERVLAAARVYEEATPHARAAPPPAGAAR